MKACYSPENTTAAYQLNWSVVLFGKVSLPIDGWQEQLCEDVQKDGVKILEVPHLPNASTLQFWVSTLPNVTPAGIIHSLKGRLQFLIRSQQPKAFRRNYCIASVGEANMQTLDRYVKGQSTKHRMADTSVQRRIENLQFSDPYVDLRRWRIGTYGRFIYNLQVVFENAEGLHDIHQQCLLAYRQMVLDCCGHKAWPLSRIGLLSNHSHILLSASMTESPESIAISLMNNLAYTQEMKPILKFSYYVGTFGNYDRDAIRRKILL